MHTLKDIHVTHTTSPAAAAEGIAWGAVGAPANIATATGTFISWDIIITASHTNAYICAHTPPHSLRLLQCTVRGAVRGACLLSCLFLYRNFIFQFLGQILISLLHWHIFFFPLFFFFQEMFQPYVNEFYVSSSEPAYTRSLKLEILTYIATPANIHKILKVFFFNNYLSNSKSARMLIVLCFFCFYTPTLIGVQQHPLLCLSWESDHSHFYTLFLMGYLLQEFNTYVRREDKVFVTDTIQAIGRCASRLREVNEVCAVVCF